MTPADLQRIGHALYGVRQWRLQFARDIGVAPVTLNRLLRGVYPVPVETADRVWSLAMRRQDETDDLFTA